MAERFKERCFDATVTIFVLSPLVVIFWCSTWTFFDHLLLPSYPTVSGVLSAGISYFLIITSYFTQDRLNNHIKVQNHVLFVVLSRIFTYTMSLAWVNNWRGVWKLLDIYTGTSPTGAGINIAVGVTCLLLCRSFRNVLAPPGIWVLDLDTQTHFSMTSRFRQQKGTVWYLLDVLFSVLVISTLVVMIWRGTWMTLEHILSSQNDALQGTITSTLGTVLVAMLSIIQYPARRISTRLHSASPFLHVLFEDVCVLVICSICVTYWFGLWTLLLVLCEGFSPMVTRSLLHVVGFGGMVALGASSSLQFKGCFIDGEYANGIGLRQTPEYFCNFMTTSSEESSVKHLPSVSC